MLASPRRFSFEFRINAVHASFFAFVAHRASPRCRARRSDILVDILPRTPRIGRCGPHTRVAVAHRPLKSVPRLAPYGRDARALPAVQVVVHQAHRHVRATRGAARERRPRSRRQGAHCREVWWLRHASARGEEHVESDLRLVRAASADRPRSSFRHAQGPAARHPRRRSERRPRRSAQSSRKNTSVTSRHRCETSRECGVSSSVHETRDILDLNLFPLVLFG